MARLFFALFSTVLFAGILGQSCESESGFYIPNVKTDWNGAVEYCNRINMRLAIVDSAAKNLAVIETVANTDGDVSNVWIGANDISKEGSFVWHASGQPVNYTSWNGINPNNDNKENCVEIANKDYTLWEWAWNDNKCHAILNFVCEFNFVRDVKKSHGSKSEVLEDVEERIASYLGQ